MPIWLTIPLVVLGVILGSILMQAIYRGFRSSPKPRARK
jgi:hypothetical protein